MAEAPPVMISMVSMLAVGMLLKSTTLLVEVPPGTRRPLISTSERCGPRLRRLAAFRPEFSTPEKVDCVRDCANEGANCGSCVAMSAKFCAPMTPIVSRPIEYSGELEMRSLRMMREPVISTRCSCANAGAAAAGRRPKPKPKAKQPGARPGTRCADETWGKTPARTVDAGATRAPVWCAGNLGSAA